MKKTYLVFVMQIAVCVLFAQKNEHLDLRTSQPTNLFKDKQQYQEYTITLIAAMPFSKSSYGFDITKDKNLVLHQYQNPLPFSPKGIQKKEDAFAIAEWIIKEYKKTGHWKTTMPPHIARLLKIESH